MKDGRFKGWGGIAAAAALIITSVFTQGTFAWFTDLQASRTVFEVGDIRYELKGGAEETDRVVVPGEPLFSQGGMYLTNLSNVDTQLRIRLMIGYVDAAGSEVLPSTPYGPGLLYDGVNPITDLIEITPAAGWEFDAGTKCFNHAADGELITVPAHEGDGDADIAVFSAMRLGGESITAEYSKAAFHIKFIFQAKQAEYAKWSDIGISQIDLLSAG